MREQEALLSFFDTQRSVEDGIIVVTVFQTAGSTYQKPGTRLLVSPAGDHCGLISGGCLEPEIIARAQTAWQHRRISAWQIDTRDDAEKWLGYGLGCKGMLWLVFEPLDFEDHYTTALIRQLLAGTPPIQRAIHRFDTQNHTLSRAIEGQKGWQTCPHFPKTGREALRTEKPNVLVLRETFSAPDQFFIYAGGADALPLAELFHTLGWQYHVICRQANLMNSPWPSAQSIAPLNREAPTDTVLDAPNHYVIIMTHNFEIDQRILLELAAKTRIPYIGLLGPDHRRDALLNSLPATDNALTHKLTQRLFSPIGLKTGGRLPSEIALSITAEIQAVRHQSAMIAPTSCHIATRPQPVQGHKHEKISVVILAAGASTRLGFPKQLVAFQNKSLIQLAIDKGQHVANHGVFVVLGAHCQTIAETLHHHAPASHHTASAATTLLFNPDWQSGLASSIKVGFQAAIPNPTLTPEHSVLFLVVDQPLVTTAHLEQLIAQARAQQDDVVASAYCTVDFGRSSHKTLGVPAIFSSQKASEIAQLSGHAGCQSIIHTAKNRSSVPCEGLNFDIDYPSDLSALNQLTVV